MSNIWHNIFWPLTFFEPMSAKWHTRFQKNMATCALAFNMSGFTTAPSWVDRCAHQTMPRGR